MSNKKDLYLAWTESGKLKDKYSINEFELYHEPNSNVLIYILDKFYGPKWRDDAISLELRKEKQNQKEEWNSGSPDDGNK